MGSAQGGEISGSLKGWFNKSMFMVVDQCFLRIRILWRHRHDLGKGWVLMSIQEICSTETNYKRLNSTPPDQQNNCTSHKDGPFPAILGDMKYCTRFFFSRRNATKPSSMFCFLHFWKRTYPKPKSDFPLISHWWPNLKPTEFLFTEFSSSRTWCPSINDGRSCTMQSRWEWCGRTKTADILPGSLSWES